MPKLFSIDEFARLKTATKKEILYEIEIRKLVKKRKEKPQLKSVVNADQHSNEFIRELQKALAALEDDIRSGKLVQYGSTRGQQIGAVLRLLYDKNYGKQLSIKIYERKGVVYTKYAYPFVRSKTVEKSTGVRVKQGYVMKETTAPKELPEQFAFLKGVTEEEDGVGNIIDGIRKALADHKNLIQSQIVKSIESKEEHSLVLKMKRYYQKYYPASYYSFENQHRINSGVEELPHNSYFRKVKISGKGARKQNANTFLPKRRKKGT